MNPNSKNYKGEKKDETKDKKEGGASAVTNFSTRLQQWPTDELYFKGTFHDSMTQSNDHEPEMAPLNAQNSLFPE